MTETFRVARQDVDVPAVTWYLRQAPQHPRAWDWTDNPDDAATFSELEAHRLAAQFNQRPANVRRGSVARADTGR